jgi:hypothetical protein
MSTILNSFSRSATLRNAAPVTGQPTKDQTPSRIGVSSLSVMLLAAVVATLVIFADRYVSVWTDGHLFFGWVVLWAVVFAGLALFAGAARNLATRAMGMLDNWSQSLAASRAESRLWEIAKSDPRVMSELTMARTREEVAEQPNDFESALAPMGLESPVAEENTTGWVGFVERLVESRAHRMQTYYI